MAFFIFGLPVALADYLLRLEFFTVELILRSGHLVGERDEAFGQRLETLVVFHLLRHLAGLFGGNALGELLPLEKALEQEIRPPEQGRFFTRQASVLDGIRASGPYRPVGPVWAFQR